MRFRNRQEAGRMLASALSDYKNAADAIVLALPRGGVPVAFEVAAALGLCLDVIVVRKLGLPSQPELAMGALGPAGVKVLNSAVLNFASVSEREIESVISREEKELLRREELYRRKAAPLPIQGRRVILIDDGLATGTSMRAAIEVVRRRGASEIIVGAPVAADETAREFEAEGIKMVCLLRPLGLEAVGQWYINFDQVSDSEVLGFLAKDSLAHKTA